MNFPWSVFICLMSLVKVLSSIYSWCNFALDGQLGLCQLYFFFFRFHYSDSSRSWCMYFICHWCDYSCIDRGQGKSKYSPWQLCELDLSSTVRFYPSSLCFIPVYSCVLFASWKLSPLCFFLFLFIDIHHMLWFWMSRYFFLLAGSYRILPSPAPSINRCHGFFYVLDCV